MVADRELIMGRFSVEVELANDMISSEPKRAIFRPTRCDASG